MHLHWKYKELVKIIVKGKSFPQVKHIAISLEAESGGILISLDKTSKGYAIIVYRGKNYQAPQTMRPKNLLTKRQALARSIELQRREVNSMFIQIFFSYFYIYFYYFWILCVYYFFFYQSSYCFTSYKSQALKHHISDLRERIELLKSELVWSWSIYVKLVLS